MPLKLCDRKHASEWSKQDYPYIQRGFIMPYYKLLDGFNTYIAPNNETANVYSQLAGLLVFIWMFLKVKFSTMSELLETTELHVTEAQAEQRRFFFELNLAADILCCTSSLITHMFQSRSRRWHDVLAICDWSGTLVITLVSIVGFDSIDLTEMIAHHVPFPAMRQMLLLTTGTAHLVFAIGALGAILVVLSCTETSHFFRFSLVFFGIVLLCLPGVTLAFFTAPWTCVLGVAFFGIGGTFFGTHYPEKACPSTFDIVCPSHTFWHIFYQCGIMCVNIAFATVFFGKSPF